MDSLNKADLKNKKICRFCLCQDHSKLTNIYMQDTGIKSSAPLHIQIMAIASIEVFSNDGMPCYVCSDCQKAFEISYQFRQMCKKADAIIRQFPLTGKLPDTLNKPVLLTNQFLLGTLATPIKCPKTNESRMVDTGKTFVKQESLQLSKKILNSSVNSDVSTYDIPSQTERDADSKITFLDKIENNEELSLDDIRQLVAAEGLSESDDVEMDNISLVVVPENQTNNRKLLNKKSIIILQEESELENDPCLRLPKVNKNVDSKTEIVADIQRAENARIQDHSQGEAYACEFCDLIFLTAEKLNSHVNIDHINEMEACGDINIIYIADEKNQETEYDIFIKPVLLQNQFIQRTLATSSKTKTNQDNMQCIGKNAVHQESSGAVISSTVISSQSERDVDCTITFLDKSENELLLNDIHQLVTAEDVSESGYVERDNVPVVIVSENQSDKPKLLNKSYRRNLNKEAEPEKEHCLSSPEINNNMDGKTLITADFQRGEKPYKCSVCDQVFSHSTMLAHHEKTHKDAPKYICVDCDRSFLLKEDMEKHVKSKVCNKSFTSSESLEPHNVIHKYEEDSNNTDVIETSAFPCSHCERTFALLQQRNIHMETHFRERKFQCDRCEKSYFTKYHLKCHSIVHTSKKPFKCSVCDRAFKNRGHLKNHEKIHKNVRKHICVDCDQSFLLKEDMEKHVKSKVCNKSFTSSESLEPNNAIHKYEEDSNNTDVIETSAFPCSYCERVFPLVQQRDIHMKIQHRERKFKCDYCKKSYFTQHQLKFHSTVHTGKKPFKCSVCDQAFKRRGHLIKHEKIHKNVRKHICSLCERSFLSKEDYEKHVEWHKQLKYFCKICNKGFINNKTLENHKAVHSRQNLYTCQYCEESFPTSGKLYSHLTTHANNIRSYTCKYCKKSLSTLHYLKRHLRSHKNIDDLDNAVSFMCIRCNCKFGNRDELISHSTIHATEMNLECSLCKDVFDNVSDLKSHIQDHSQGEAYACEFCDLIFLTAEKLQSHLDIDHIAKMEAYITDDHTRTNKLQETTCDFFVKPISLTSQFIQGTLATPSKIKPNQDSIQDIGKTSVQQESLLLTNKILSSCVNSSAALISSEISSQFEKNVYCSITYLNKSDNNELSPKDKHRLVVAEDVSESGYVERDNVPVVIVSENQINQPKLLNKSSMVILNKEAEEPENDPGLSLQKLNNDVDSRMEIVVDFQRGEMPHKCSVCDQFFSHSTMLMHHEKTHTDVPKYVCVDCGQSFLLKEDIEKHVKSKVCNKSFASSESLEPHNVIDKYEEDSNNTDVIETYLFPCSLCERVFPLVQQRDIHMKTQHRERKFKCDYCEKSFFRLDQKKNHSDVHHVHTNQEAFKCSVCNQAFKLRGYLKKHEKIHKNVRKHICRLCERSFLSKEDYEKHVEWHKQLEYFCKICNKGFINKKTLEHHKAVHSRHKLYTCQYCEESFPNTAKLYNHLKAHAGDVRYFCKYCKKSFTRIYNLNCHLRSHKNVDDPGDELISPYTIHANEMNLACSLCKDVFDKVSDLNSHIQEHSQGEVYACEFCDLLFLTAEKLQSHLDIDHIAKMEAHNTDDHTRTNKLREDNISEINNIDIAEEKLQESAYDFLVDSKILLKKKDIESETPSPKTINQIIQSRGNEIEEDQTQTLFSKKVILKTIKVENELPEAPSFSNPVNDDIHFKNEN